MHANVSLCPFNFTVLPHTKLFSPINTDFYANENVTKACTLLYTAVHDPPFDPCNHNNPITFRNKTGSTLKKYWCTASLIKPRSAEL